MPETERKPRRIKIPSVGMSVRIGTFTEGRYYANSAGTAVPLSGVIRRIEFYDEERDAFLCRIGYYDHYGEEHYAENVVVKEGVGDGVNAWVVVQ